ncbi:MAG: hypothetical protein RML14_10650 [Meiothermus sp.]|uniref:hypothetical protein n=1 Tax=Meiothermus sp. TaxID=1955249 RepID=UPI00298EDA92|nr:hypothetical protein [Meiothermus sp.]MDW8482302.1 hypothetical protein [Meiothermus sp.]
MPPSLVQTIAAGIVLLNAGVLLLFHSNSGFRSFAAAMVLAGALALLLHQPFRAYLAPRLPRRFWLVSLAALAFDAVQTPLFRTEGSTFALGGLLWVLLEEMGRAGLYLLGVVNPPLNTLLWLAAHPLQAAGLGSVGFLLAGLAYGTLWLGMSAASRSIWGSAFLHLAVNLSPFSIQIHVWWLPWLACLLLGSTLLYLSFMYHREAKRHHLAGL